MTHTEGFVYVATGAKYVAEATESLQSLRKTNPGYPVCLVTDKEPENKALWDYIVLIPEPHFNLDDKIQMYRCPFEKAIFLDTDTLIVRPLSDLFRLLDHFDLAAHQLYEGHEYELPDIPHAFPEFNTGVVVFRNNQAFYALCADWSARYDKKTWINDQRSFRIAVYHSRLRHTVLTPEYNFRPLSTNFACMDLRIIHGRTFEKLKMLETEMNELALHRAYVPRLDAVVSDFMPLKQIKKVFINSFMLMLKEYGKRVTGTELRNRLRKIKWIRRVFLKNKYQEHFEG